MWNVDDEPLPESERAVSLTAQAGGDTEPSGAGQRSPDPVRILSEVFGYSGFRGRQREIIDCVAGGGDALVLMPTGGGKSLCYQIPALIRPGCGVVISPLIALMQDQVAALRQSGVRAAALNSAESLARNQEAERALLDGRLDLLYIAPERLMLPRTLDLLARARVALFAIDEAHCVSQWGHDFRPEYIQLSLLAERFPGVPRLALTATADAPTRREIVTRLGLERARQFVSRFDRPNIRYRISQSDAGGGSARDRLLRFIRQEHPGEAGIVYCLSRKRVEAIADWLAAQGLEALPYHAGLSVAERDRNQKRFLTGEGVIMVATIAFGMGIDKPNVRFVAHLNLPKSIEAYYQETGRAGRDGLPADAWMLYGLQDVITLRQMLDQSNADDGHKRVERQKLEAMLGLCELTSCRRQALLAYFGDDLDSPCGNCDTCLEPPATWDATEPARKALSCVYRTGERFGVNYLIDVLRGRETDRLRALGHHHLSTFGIGTELEPAEWRVLFRQLIARGLLRTDLDGHGGLSLDESCRPLLRGETTVELRRDQRPARSPRERGSRAARPAADLAPEDQALWDALRACRRRLADAQGVPPYVIFHDVTLAEMLHEAPVTLDQMAGISGVGISKLDRYGDEFLRVIRGHLGL
ncbi:ATP-dependent DNA helicase RecQ [Thioalkalivibrio nitratireducens DSM 14787]|uniref:DNA helicase RecQ n=1 Tax=Thioalkalivibrio nitratireducens (strain DSM 14787 / UNIQEM 213 / ALEN2) TaxID=1255043 RepID=L0E0R9_THIND|nr:DNA helicase RecQ [Thioalkalivibrio nitratireducens]AGA34847.1 ATP-dependent DNA helicase RecQ [Thioalkalivibrio nitratireducens DSM 14787]